MEKKLNDIHRKKQQRTKCLWHAKCFDGMWYFGSGKNINYSFLRVLNILEEICVVFNRLVRARDFKIMMMFLDINHNEDPQF